MKDKKYSYREILKEEYERRKSSNSKYSLRAFARDIGVAQSSLVLILNGKQGLSLKKAERILENLSLPFSQRVLFCSLVESEHARSRDKRETASKRVENYENHDKFSLTADEMENLDRWYFPFILEVSRLKDFAGKFKFVSERLSISEDELNSALKTLEKLNLVEIKEDHYIVKNDHWFVSLETTRGKKGVFKSHVDTLRHIESLIEKNMNEDNYEESPCCFGSVAFSMDIKEYPDAKKELFTFLNEFVQKYSADEKEKGSVFTFSTNLIEIK